ncbi:MAG TPA: hypothetical protein VF541_04780 [Longimicrobium sp.]|jgi:hypothetical protein
MRIISENVNARTARGPVPRGAERARELAGAWAEAKRRIRAHPSPLLGLTADEIERFRASNQPEISG